MQTIQGTESERSKEQKYLSKQKEKSRGEKRTQCNTSTIKLNRQKYCNISPQSHQSHGVHKRAQGGNYSLNQHIFSSKQLADNLQERFLYDFGPTQRSTQPPSEDQGINENSNFIAQFQRRIQEKMRPLQANQDEYLNFEQCCEDTILEADDDQYEEQEGQQYYYPSNHQLGFRGANQQQHWEQYDPHNQQYCQISAYQQDSPSTPLKFFAASNQPAARISTPHPYLLQQSPLSQINQQFTNNLQSEKPSDVKWLTLSKQRPTLNYREVNPFPNTLNYRDESLIRNDKNNHMQQQQQQPIIDDYRSKQLRDYPQRQPKIKELGFELMDQETTIDSRINLSALREGGRRNAESSAQKINELIRIKDFEFSLSSKIGEGSFSTVYRGRSKSNPSIPVAVKVIDLSKQGSKFKDEIQICMKVNGHQNILRIYDHHIDKASNKCYLFLEFCKDGSLQDLLPKISRRQAIIFFRQIMDGMLELHRHLIIHRDIKLENILLCGTDVKISDFGLSKQISNNQLEVNSIKCGTPSTMAPEIYFSRHNYPSYSSKCDVWSLGVILHEMFYKAHPFDMDKENLRKCQRVQVQNKCSIVEDFLSRSLVPSQSARIALKSILSHSIYTAELARFNLLETNKNRYSEEKQIIQPGIADQVIKKILPSASFQQKATIILPPETEIRYNNLKEKRTTIQQKQQSNPNEGQQDNFLTGFGLDKTSMLSLLLLLIIMTLLSIILPKIL